MATSIAAPSLEGGFYSTIPLEDVHSSPVVAPRIVRVDCGAVRMLGGILVVGAQGIARLSEGGFGKSRPQGVQSRASLLSRYLCLW